MKSSHLWIAAGVAGVAGVLYMLTRGRVSALQLLAIAPALRTRPDLVAAHLGPLNDALVEADAATPKRAAAFLAQMMMESDQLRGVVEYASGEAYEGRKDLGNTQKGDGVRYKGRGVVHLTGRANYRTYGEKLGLPLEASPELAAEPRNAWRIAARYWRDRNLSAKADAGDFVGITRAINGGTNGLETRQAFLARALPALGVPA